MKLFVYGTLRHHPTVKKALGHDKKETPATLNGYTEKHVYRAKEVWPTLESHNKGMVKGYLMDVDKEELHKLDNWESRYKRHEVETEHGKAYTYILK